MRWPTTKFLTLATVALFSTFFGVGCSDTSIPAGTVSAAVGANQTVLIGTTVTLDGTGSSGVTKALWSFTSVPTGSAAALSQGNTLTPTFIPDLAGDYVVQLSINNGASAASMTVTAKTAVATITPGAGVSTRVRFGVTEYVVNLDQVGAVLAASAQVGGGDSVATYAWSQITGPSGTITDGAAAASMTFTAPGLVNFLGQSDHQKWQPMVVSRYGTKMVFQLTITTTSGITDTTYVPIYVQDDGVEIPTSFGLPNYGVGKLIYMSGPDIKYNTDATAVTDWTWTMTPPAGSSTVFADTGTTTSNLQFPKFTPDVAGIYSIAYNSTSGTVTPAPTAITGLTVPGTIGLNAASYVGVGTIGGTTPVDPQCGACHNGTVQDDMVTPWSGTIHASIFSTNMGAYAGLSPTPYLWQYNTVGYSTGTQDSGFQNAAAALGFEFPAAGMTYSAFTTNYPTIATFANVQCENCHGPGSGHSGNTSKIMNSFSQFGVCGQCHYQEREWVNSVHNTAAGSHESSWIGASCDRCHSSQGFDNYTSNGTFVAASETGVYPGITCAGCHDPHDATNTHQLRFMGNVTMLIDNSTVDAGIAAVCYLCHDGFYEYKQSSSTSGCFSDGTGKVTTPCLTNDQAATTYIRQVHHNPQAPVLEGKGASTDLQNGDGTGAFTFTTSNSFHSGSNFILSVVTGNPLLPDTNKKCVTCHMAAGPGPSEAGYQHMGGHSFSMADGDTDHVSACTPCHPTFTDLNPLAAADYDGDGTIEGVQDEVRGVLWELYLKIKSYDTNGVLSLTVTTPPTVSPETIVKDSTIAYKSGTKPAGTSCLTVPASTTTYQICNFLNLNISLRRAIWNYNMITQEGSFGDHNTSFDIQVLQKTYTALAQILGGTTFAQDYPNATLR